MLDKAMSVIGFLYTCDGTNAAGTWEIKNIEVK